eukprot:2741894-Amphidinium_carterae.1
MHERTKDQRSVTVLKHNFAIDANKAPLLARTDEIALTRLGNRRSARANRPMKMSQDTQLQQ